MKLITNTDGLVVGEAITKFHVKGDLVIEEYQYLGEFPLNKEYVLLWDSRYQKVIRVWKGDFPSLGLYYSGCSLRDIWEYKLNFYEEHAEYMRKQLEAKATLD